MDADAIIFPITPPESLLPLQVATRVSFNQIDIIITRAKRISTSSYDISAANGLLDDSTTLIVVSPKSSLPMLITGGIGFNQIDIRTSCAKRISCSCNNITPITGLLDAVAIIIIAST